MFNEIRCSYFFVFYKIHGLKDTPSEHIFEASSIVRPDLLEPLLQTSSPSN